MSHSLSLTSSNSEASPSSRDGQISLRRGSLRAAEEDAITDEEAPASRVASSPISSIPRRDSFTAAQNIGQARQKDMRERQKKAVGFFRQVCSDMYIFICGPVKPSRILGVHGKPKDRQRLKAAVKKVLLNKALSGGGTKGSTMGFAAQAAQAHR